MIAMVRYEYLLTVINHQNIDPAINEDHKVANARSLFEIIDKSCVVKTVFQGNYHPGISNEYEGVKYITLPAMRENKIAYFVYDI